MDCSALPPHIDARSISTKGRYNAAVQHQSVQKPISGIPDSFSMPLFRRRGRERKRSKRQKLALFCSRSTAMNCINCTSPELAVVVDNPSTVHLYHSIEGGSSKDCRRLGLSVEIKNTHKLRVVSCHAFFCVARTRTRTKRRTTTINHLHNAFRSILEGICAFEQVKNEQ